MSNNLLKKNGQNIDKDESHLRPQNSKSNPYKYTTPEQQKDTTTPPNFPVKTSTSPNSKKISEKESREILQSLTPSGFVFEAKKKNPPSELTLPLPGSKLTY